jgi:beta-phosphoglucomutase-like phosphatase (HAD superfamily)
MFKKYLLNIILEKNLSENEVIIYLDMDGVLADFEKMKKEIIKKHNLTEDQKQKIWDLIKKEKLFETLDVLEENILEEHFNLDGDKVILLKDLEKILTTFFERKIKL